MNAALGRPRRNARHPSYAPSSMKRPRTPPPASERPRNLRELAAAGWRPKSVKHEIRDNLLARLQAKETVFPGIVGYDTTVVPQVENALLSGHDFILLGLRGQAKTRLLRALPSLLDDEIPAVEGCEIRDDPSRPVCAACLRRRAELGDELPIRWVPRSERLGEKLATPDVTIADLIGDVDPIKAATRKLVLADPEVLHFGLIPRSNRGIVVINELPDLSARIQVGLLGILEEGDIQIRGFPLRLPLDLLFAFSANPEDYTNRGSIITPLRDRISSQILTHYPRTLGEARRITEQEAWVEREGAPEVLVPGWLRDAIEEVAFQARRSELVDPSSGVSARVPIALYENVVSNAERRALATGEKPVTARAGDLFAALPAVTGKIELVYEGEREGVQNVALHLVGRALKAVFDANFPDAYAEGDGGKGGSNVYEDVVRWFQGGRKVDVSDALSSEELRQRLRGIPRLEELAKEHLGAKTPAEVAGGMELLLEGLHQAGLLSRHELEGGREYRDVFEQMAKELGS
jgi:magnesium chelatase subunit I